MRKLSRISLSRAIGYSSSGLLALLLLIIACPTASNRANAADCQPGDPEPCATATATQEVGVAVASSVSIAMNNQTIVDVIPRGENSFASKTGQVYVATNNSTGYALYMNAQYSDENGATLVSVDPSNNNIIKPVVGQVTSSNFTRNTWGYSLNGTTYQAVPTSATVIDHADSATNKDTYNLSFGVSIDASLPAGYYDNNVIISAVANPRMIKNLEEAIYLQDFDGTRNTNGTTATSSKICEQSTVGMTKQLIDTRDGKKYWVAKLADNNCWMVQNLALDLSTSKPLTAADSDVTNNWTPTTATSMSIPGKTSNPPQTGTNSWNIGKYVLATPQKGVTCTAPSGAADQWDSVLTGQTLDRCPDFQKVDDSWTYDDAKQGTWNGYPTTGTALIAANTAAKTYDSHYLIGNYYQWNTATAGTGSSINTANADAPSSICPKGWHLPTSSRTSAGIPIGSDDSFAKLLAAYGYPQPDQSNGWSFTDKIGYVVVNYAGATRLDGAPMYFVHSGNVDLPYGALRNAGATGLYWSSTAFSTAALAYSLYFNASNVYPSHNANRYRGFPVRCVAR